MGLSQRRAPRDLPCSEAGHRQGARVRFQPLFPAAGRGPLLCRTLSPGAPGAGMGANPLTGSLDSCWARGASQLSEARVPTPPGGRCTLPSPLKAVWPWDKGIVEVPFVPCSGAPGSLHLGPFTPSLLFSFSSETGKCLSRAKASPQAQLSCSKAGSVESCSLSCPAHTHFMPGNPGLSLGWGGGWGLPSLGSSSCLLLSSKNEPHLRRRDPQPRSLSDSGQPSGSLRATVSLSARAVGSFLPNHLPHNRVAKMN